MISREDSTRKDVLMIVMSGTLVKADYDQFNQWTDDILEKHECMRLLCILDDFHGWGEFAAAWEDAKYGMTHRSDIEKFAMVGEEKWEAWMAKIAGFLMPGEVQYFDQSEKQSAIAWIMR